MANLNNIILYKKEIIAIIVISIVFTASTYLGTVNFIKYKKFQEKTELLKQEDQKLEKTIEILRKIKIKKIKQENLSLKIPFTREGKFFVKELYQKGILFLEAFEITSDCTEESCYQHLIIKGQYAYFH